MKIIPGKILMVVILMGISIPLNGQTVSDSLKSLEEKIALLAREIQSLKLEKTLKKSGLFNDNSYGLGPAAGKVYNENSGVSIAGYGEMLYQNFSETNQKNEKVEKTDQIDFYRQVFFFGYRFNERFLFNSEVEYEHGSTGKSGEVSVEFAYLDFIISEGINLRAGMLLSPLGIINEYHEPSTWYSTVRPLAESYIIPTTWRGNGIGILGSYSKLNYKLYLTEGLNAEGFTAQKALRGGRQKGSKAIAEKFALSGSLSYEFSPGISGGVSGYYGDSGQNIIMDNEKELDVLTTIFSAHILIDKGPFHIRTLYASTYLGNTNDLNAHLQNDPDQAVASRSEGYYFTFAYNILPLFKVYDLVLAPYFHYEHINTQIGLAQGYTENDLYIGQSTAIGLGFKPITEVIIKADYRINSVMANTGVNQFNIVLGYMF